MRSIRKITVLFVILAIAGACSLKNKWEEMEFQGDRIYASYIAKDEGPANTAKFFYGDIWHLANKHQDMNYLTVDVFVISKDGETFEMGTNEVDLQDVRKYNRNRYLKITRKARSNLAYAIEQVVRED